MSDVSPHMIAVDWGTTRLRAMLVAKNGRIVDISSADEGIMSVPAGGYPEVLKRHIGAWLTKYGRLPIMMAGMVGSRNGWVEAAYIQCPTAITAFSQQLTRIPFEGGEILLVPGLSARDTSGTPDVIRGEEVKLIGCGLKDGTVVTPGTHSKWASLRGGVIETFSSFMTGDFYGALMGHTILGKLAEEPHNEAGFARGLAAAERHGGLTHQAFSARTSVLLGDMSGHEVGPFLSGLLIGTEVVNGLKLDRASGEILLIADGVFARNYTQAFSYFGHEVRVLDPEDCVIAGLMTLYDAATSQQTTAGAANARV